MHNERGEEMGEERFWVVRVPKGQKVIEAVKRQGVVAVGFSITQSLGNVKDRESMKDLYRSVCPDARERRVNAAIGQLHRIVHVIKEGDWILTPDRDRRIVLFGRARGSYEFHPNAIDEEHHYPHVRRVKWMGEFSRDDMSTALRNTMGGLATVFDLGKHARELLRLMQQSKGTGGKDDTEDGIDLLEDTRAKADELIADLIARIDPYDLQDLVAGLLHAMGYRTRVSERGPDQGVDVVAHPDALGFESPKIKVQVKHRQSSAGGPDIRNLVGTLAEGEKGLFVSTGGFTTEALNEARRNPRLTLINAQELVELLIEYYEQLDSDYKALIPLRKVWIPISS